MLRRVVLGLKALLDELVCAGEGFDALDDARSHRRREQSGNRGWGCFRCGRSLVTDGLAQRTDEVSVRDQDEGLREDLKKDTIRGPRLRCPGATESDGVVVARGAEVVSDGGAQFCGVVVEAPATEHSVGSRCHVGAIFANFTRSRVPFSIVPVENPLPYAASKVRMTPLTVAKQGAPYVDERGVRSPVEVCKLRVRRC